MKFLCALQQRLIRISKAGEAASSAKAELLKAL
jgi:hypothetical protein